MDINTKLIIFSFIIKIFRLYFNKIGDITLACYIRLDSLEFNTYTFSLFEGHQKNYN